jgi:hypothetical protein
VSESGLGEQWFGVGEAPESLQRFSWGAFVLTPVWGAVYGVWPVLLVWLTGMFVQLLIASLVPLSAGVALISLATVVSQVIGSALRFWIGMRAYAWYWQREHLRLTRSPQSRPRYSVQSFAEKQRRWNIGSAVYLAATFGGLLTMATSSDAAVLDAMSQLNLTSNLVWVSIAWTAAEVVLAVWLDRQMRQSAPAQPAEDL